MNAKHKLMQTIKILLEQHAFEKITVEMILKESGVSRATFYRCYEDKYDLLHGYYKHYLDTIVFPAEFRITKLTEQLLIFLNNNKSYYVNVVKYNGNRSFLDYFYETGVRYCEKNLMRVLRRELDAGERAAISFYCAGTGFCIVQWIKGGMKIPPKEQTRFLCRNIPKELKIFI
jgi:AcrR family transcriptional regulator